MSSLRAFFEQQGNATANSQPGTPESSAANGNGQKARVKSNFIPVSRTMNFSPDEKLEAVPKAVPPVTEPSDAISKPGKVERTLDVGEVKQVKDTFLPAKAVQVTPPSIPQSSASHDVKPQAEDAKSAATGKLEFQNLASKEENKKEEGHADHKILSTSDKSQPVISTRIPSIVKVAAASSSPKLSTTPKKPISASITPKSTPTPAIPKAVTPIPKSPPTPKRTPISAKSSPKEKTPLGPLSPTKSSSSRRSSSPFLVSPTGTKLTPQRGSGPAATSSSKIPTPRSQARYESTPKSLNQAPRSNPPTNVTPAPPQFGTSQTPAKTAPPSNELSPPPIKEAQFRPRSAHGNLTSPAGTRRIVSHPPRPATAASNKPSPNVTRSTSLRNPTRSKPLTSVHPPVPSVARAAGSLSPDHNDYSHLPAFMRPTQASSGKVVPKPASTGDKRRARAGSFKV